MKQVRHGERGEIRQKIGHVHRRRLSIASVGNGCRWQVGCVSQEDQMNTRRSFLAELAMASVWFTAAKSEQAPQSGPTPRPPQERTTPAEAAPTDSPNMPSPEKRMLEENAKEIKKKVEKLYQLATELKTEVDKTDSSKVLSLTMLKKTEEIEKLARDIRNRSKG